MAITRLSGGTTPANGSDPRTFPTIWNDAADDIEAAESAIAAIEANDWVTTARIEDGAVTAAKLANTAGAVMVFDDDTARGSAIPSPSEGMVTYLKDTNQVQAFNGSAFAPIGTILQVVQGSLTSPFTTSVAQGAEATVTGLSATITPGSTSSKVLVIVTLSAGNTLESRQQHFFAIFRDATRVGVGDAADTRQRVSSGNALEANGNGISSMGMTFEDTPATTSALTYTVKVSHNHDSTQTILINRSSTDADSTRSGRAISTITLMEVAG